MKSKWKEAVKKYKNVVDLERSTRAECLKLFSEVPIGSLVQYESIQGAGFLPTLFVLTKYDSQSGMA